MLDNYLSRVLSICAEEFDVSIEDVRSLSKRQELVYCRKAFCLVVKETMDVKLEVIGKKIGRSENAVSVFVARQPDNKYYKVCLRRVRGRVKGILEE